MDEASAAASLAAEEEIFRRVEAEMGRYGIIGKHKRDMEARSMANVEEVASLVAAADAAAAATGAGAAAAAEQVRVEMKARILFASIDADGSGTLDGPEIRQLARKLGYTNELTREQLVDAMLEMDGDDSGEVDFDEFYDWWLRRLAGGGSTSGVFKAETTDKGQDGDGGGGLSRDNIQQAFDEVDIDKGGTLNRYEIHKLAVALLGRMVNATEVEQMMKEMDEDGGGDVDFNEFYAWFSKSPKAAAAGTAGGGGGGGGGAGGAGGAGGGAGGAGGGAAVAVNFKVRYTHNPNCCSIPRLQRD